jgi:competence protein ComEC
VSGDAVLLQAPRRWASGDRVALATLATPPGPGSAPAVPPGAGSAPAAPPGPGSAPAGPPGPGSAPAGPPGAGSGDGFAAGGSLRVLLRAPARVAWPAGLGAGDVVAARGSLRPLGAGDGWLRVRGVHATVAVEAVRATGRRRGGLAGAVDGIRRRAERALTARVPAGPGALLRGMALGQDEALPARVRDEFRTAGLAHLVAASGQNVMLLAALVVLLSALLGVGLHGRLALVLAAIALYVPLAGGGPSIQRAGIMGAAGTVALLAGRPALRWHALLLAAAGTLVAGPRAAEDPGWQLSFAAVLGILLLGPRIRHGLERRGVPHAAGEAVAVTAAATLATAPLVAAHFGRTSLVALPANVLAVPAVAPAMWLGMLAAAVGQVSPAAAAVPAALAAIPAAALQALAHVAAGLPHAEAGVPAAVVAATCAAVAAGIASRRLRRPLAIAAVAAAALAAALRDPPPTPPAGVRLSVLDVGQGDATLLQDGRRAVLVDTGPRDGPILRRLREAGVGRLDALLVTHAQADHLGAAAEVLDAMPVGLLLDGRDGVREPEGARMAAVAARRRVRRVAAVAGDVVRAGRIALRVLWPPAGGAASSGATGGDPNDRAVVARADAGGLSALLTADAESPVLAGLDLRPADVLKVAHHGSADEGLPGVLARVRPSVAVVSAGRGNPYGHPVPDTLAALRATGAAVQRTDRDGTVRVTPAGARLRVEAGGR